jgi:predicted transcriptional regulator
MKRSLTDEQVKEARKLHFDYKVSQTELANKFKCSITTISLWVDPREERRVKKFRERKVKEIVKLDDTKIEMIKRLKAQGYNSYDVHLITKYPLEEVNLYFANTPVDMSDIYTFD